MRATRLPGRGAPPPAPPVDLAPWLAGSELLVDVAFFFNAALDLDGTRSIRERRACLALAKAALRDANRATWALSGRDDAWRRGELARRLQARLELLWALDRILYGTRVHARRVTLPFAGRPANDVATEVRRA